MREILFRGKNYDGEWIEGYYVHQGKSHEIYYKDYQEFPSRFVTPETVGQYTGLTDKNGKKIFEGDIVQGFWYPTGEKVVGVVKYYERTAKYCICGNRIVGLSHCRNIEAIGNIHDNPELLGGRDE